MTAKNCPVIRPFDKKGGFNRLGNLTPLSRSCTKDSRVGFTVFKSIRLRSKIEFYVLRTGDNLRLHPDAIKTLAMRSFWGIMTAEEVCFLPIPGNADQAVKQKRGDPLSLISFIDDKGHFTLPAFIHHGITCFSNYFFHALVSGWFRR